MKKLLFLLLSLILVVALSGCAIDSNSPIQKGSSPAPEKPVNQVFESAAENSISREEAINIALSKAELERSSVYELEAELDREPGRLVWEVGFEHNFIEYSLDIDAISGEVLFFERDFD